MAAMVPMAQVPFTSFDTWHHVVVGRDNPYNFFMYLDAQLVDPIQVRSGRDMVEKSKFYSNFNI